MTIRELIAELSKYDPYLPVYRGGDRDWGPKILDEIKEEKAENYWTGDLRVTGLVLK